MEDIECLFLLARTLIGHELTGGFCASFECQRSHHARHFTLLLLASLGFLILWHLYICHHLQVVLFLRVQVLKSSLVFIIGQRVPFFNWSRKYLGTKARWWGTKPTKEQALQLGGVRCELSWEAKNFWDLTEQEAYGRLEDHIILLKWPAKRDAPLDPGAWHHLVCCWDFCRRLNG